MRACVPVFVMAVVSVGLAGCQATGFDLRYDYLGRQIVEPGLTVRPTEHDAYGNAILPKPRTPPPQWPVYRP